MPRADIQLSHGPGRTHSLAFVELAELAARVPHLDFGLARRRAIVDALLRPTRVWPAESAAPAFSSRLHIAKNQRQY